MTWPVSTGTKFEFLAANGILLDETVLRPRHVDLHNSSSLFAYHINPINLSRPMSAPHSQFSFPSTEINSSSSFYPATGSALDHRRTSKPTLQSGSHLSVEHRPVDSRYSRTSSFPTPTPHYSASSRLDYAVHSRIGGDASLTGNRSQQTRSDFSELSINSPPPLPVPTQSVDPTGHAQSLPDRRWCRQTC